LEAYLKGRYYFNRRSEQDLLKAAEYFERAISRDPGYALAFAGLADCLNLMPQYGSTAPRDAIPRARKAAAQAIALDDDLAEGHTSLAWALLTYDWDWAAADREFRRAIDLNPNYDTARLWYGYSLTWRGRFEEGVAQLQQARRLDPVATWTLANIAIASYLARDYDRAIREAADVVELNNTLPAGHVWRGLPQLQQGLHDEAVRSLEQGLALGPERATRLARAGYVYGVTGQREKARAILARITNISRSKYVSAVDFAIVHLGLGEKTKALDWLDRGIDERGSEMMFIKTDPRFDLVRSEPRFERLLQVMNFPN
jgi:tetratricopeptide (TPR) repeat protein